MKKKSILLLGLLVFAVCPAGVAACTPPSQSSTPSAGTNSNSMMGPAGANALSTALQLKEKAHLFLDQASEQGLDVSEIADLIAEADALLEKVQKIVRANPIPASNLAREAAHLYENALSDLEALLG